MFRKQIKNKIILRQEYNLAKEPMAKSFYILKLYETLPLNLYMLVKVT